MDLSWGQWVVGLLVATLWHELGHLVAAKLVRMPVRRIFVGLGPKLWQQSLTHETDLVLRALPVGMSIAVEGRYDATGALRRPVWHDLWVAAAGPLASLLLSLVVVVGAALLHVGPQGMALAVSLATLSTLLALINLLPVPGLDGGHLLVLLLAWLGPRLSPARETRLHRLGVQAVVVLSLIPLIYLAAQHAVGSG